MVLVQVDSEVDVLDVNGAKRSEEHLVFTEGVESIPDDLMGAPE